MSRFDLHANPPSALAKAGNLPLKARLIVEGALTGMHRARLHGSSVEFAEHKEYSPGDEVRHIDWKAYAKLDRYYVKQFEQESKLTAYLVLDTSASMSYSGSHAGTHAGESKLAYASYLLAALAHLLIHQRDQVGLSAFGDERMDVCVPPRARPSHLGDLFAVIEELNQRGGRGQEPATQALERLAELLRRRRALIVMVSDLLGDPDSDQSAVSVLRRLRVQGHDVVLFHVLHPDELELPFHGLTLFESLEDGRKLLANPDIIRRQYLQELEAFVTRIERGCTDGGVEYHRISTAQPVERTLLDFLTARARGAAPRRSWNF